MKGLFETSQEKYLTGMTALNIPTEDGKSADWHFLSVFSTKNRKGFRIAGENIISTNEIFGNYGIKECSQILRAHGISIDEGVKVYSANFVRALLDLIYNNIVNGSSLKHIEVDELLDYEEDKKEFWEKFKVLKDSIKDQIKLNLLNLWENANKEAKKIDILNVPQKKFFDTANKIIKKENLLERLKDVSQLTDNERLEATKQMIDQGCLKGKSEEMIKASQEFRNNFFFQNERI